MLPNTRLEAKRLESSFYFTHKFCKNGHLERRRTSNGSCLMCESVNYKQSYHRHVGKHHVRMNQYYADHKNDMNNTNRQWYANNPSAVKRFNQAGYIKDPERYIRQTHKRRMRLEQATPLWVEHAEIKSLYRQCAEISKATGIKHHVDHIVPIENALVCGLNCLANLRITTATENLKKKNHWTIE